MRGAYNHEKKKKEYPSNKIISHTLNKVFSDMWREDLGVSRKVVDISFVTHNFGKWFKPDKKHDAAKMLRFVIEKLIDEQNPLKMTLSITNPDRSDFDVEKYYNSCKLSKNF